MEDSKTLLFYLFGLAGLITISILFTGRIEPPPFEPLPAISASPTATPTPAELAQAGCSTTTERAIFYVPDLTTLEDNRLRIFGAVYASDFVTPLPGALIEVWPATYDSPENTQYPPYLFRGQILSSHGESVGPLLRGPVDIVLPVPPPVSFRTNLIPPDVTGEPLTISGVVYAADGETPLPGARVEVWQANPTGFYDGFDYPPPPFNLGGQMLTTAAGRYEFTTLKPSPFKVDQKYLPAQIHFQVRYQGHKSLFTRLFFADDPYLDNIPALPELTIRLSEQVGPTGPAWQGNFDVTLPISPPVP